MIKKIVKPSILPGFMELLPSDQILFNKMTHTIQKSYEKFGFVPFDTPVIEKSEVLLAKGGGETEKQVYRFLKGESDVTLRFDLTVPLARYVAQHFPDLEFPFRRYHIAKVFRGERNQKGRFREFCQCDIDIVGNGKLSIMNDAEIPSIIYSTFCDLGFEAFTIRISNRKILNGFFDALGVSNPSDVMRIIDKLDKIGARAVHEELFNLGMAPENIDQILSFIHMEGSNHEKLEALQKMDIENDLFQSGIKELSQVIGYIKSFRVPEKNYTIDLAIARGLDYYTGTIYETVLDEYPGIGSICSGGRYDNLAEYYTTQKLPGVGISIGLTRLFYQLREAKIMKDNSTASLTQVLVIPMNDCIDYSIMVASQLRDRGIISQLYSEEGKLAKKFGYADKLGISYVILIGENEMQHTMITLKNMKTGFQELISLENAVIKILNNNYIATEEK